MRTEYVLAHPVTLGGPGIIIEIDESLFCRRKHTVGRVVLGLRRDKSGDASKERLPGGVRSSECCHTPPDTTAVRAARHDSSVGVLGGLQHDPADRIPALDG